MLSIGKEWGLAMRAGLAVGIEPGLKYAVPQVYNEWEEKFKGILQALTIDLPHNLRLTGTHVSPNVSCVDLTNFFTVVMSTGTEKD